MRRIPMHMTDWIKKLDAFLTVNEREILTHAGRISHEIAMEVAEVEYKKFNQRQIRQKDHLDSDFDKTVKQLTNGKRGEKINLSGDDKQLLDKFCRQNGMNRDKVLKLFDHIIFNHKDYYSFLEKNNCKIS
ncbi:MAG: hypothetical protein SRB2_04879 [Desulfobacteraceae bacterium Eth-SRB2]|nr:MAG: hypothetical protein SRB2_04879 [Desulfobacteraceae bacterium Eth-SRB2]